MGEAALAVLGMATQLGGSAIEAYGEYTAGQEQKKVFEANAAEAERAAVDARIRGASGVGDIRAQGSKVIGEQRAAAAGAGVDVGSGSVLDVISQTRVMSELDVARLKNNALREAYGYKVQANNLYEQGNLAAKGGILGVGSSILTGVSGAVNTGYQSGLFSVGST